jgi:Predicted hydrolases or acyltransferases (alpha/beta hydrolase superfamily)
MKKKLSLKPSAQTQTLPTEIKHPPGDFLIVNGAKLWYESEGKGEPLLLIAGGPGAAHYFHPYFSSLAYSYRLIYFDAFGRGKSDRAKSPKEYTFKRDVDDIEGLRKALNLGKINLLGHSYGGIVAQAYTLRYSDSVKRLILADTLFSGEMWQANNDSCNYELRNQYPEVWKRIGKLRAQGFQSSAKEHQEAYQLPRGLLYYYDASSAEKRPQIDFNPEVYYAIVGDDGDFLIGGDIGKLDFRTELKNLKMPTLILAGRYDRVSQPRFAVQFKRYAPQAQFVMFEKSGHYPFIEETAKMMGILRKFLSK